MSIARDRLERRALDTVEIRQIQFSEYEQARALLSANGWAARVSDPAKFSQLLI
jgi:hypothetical protein